MSVQYYDPYAPRWATVVPFTTVNLGEFGRHEALSTWFGGPFNTTRLPGQMQARYFYVSYYWAINGQWQGVGEMFYVNC